ncbi:UbiA family prenyltransferase [Pantoea ananatis]|uniref:UbiA family prenyltransferase n=1 Tax=Pantoea ananas TaxID=553 RepID=UPI00221FD3D9|nr:UbiA family prenyltransferase [Pantoea ananatis]
MPRCVRRRQPVALGAGAGARRRRLGIAGGAGAAARWRCCSPRRRRRSTLLDARIDAQMARTSWRPLVVGKVLPWQVLLFATLLTALSMTVLVVWVNGITAGCSSSAPRRQILVPVAVGMSGVFYLGGTLVLTERLREADRARAQADSALANVQPCG